MKPDPTHSRLVTLALLLLAAVPVMAAPKRRAVNPPTAGVPFTVTLKGTVVDAATGSPVAFASVALGESRTSSSGEGVFELANVTAVGTSASVVASRSGYNSATLTISGGGTHTLNFQLQSRPPITVHLTNGSTILMDDDSVKLGYVVVFGGYVASEQEDFCKSDGTAVTIPATAMKRIVGPAVLVTQPNCCSREGAQLQRVRVELRTGEANDLIFKDSCDGYTIDLLGRNHVTGSSVFTKFSEITEVVFP